jgi:hypothetical protein
MEYTEKLSIVHFSNSLKVPNVPNVPNLSNVPNVSNLSNVPNVPNVPNLPNVPNVPNVPNYMKDMKEVVPKIVFIVPYRNRPQQKFFFEKYMSYLLEDFPKGEIEIYFSNQTDMRNFNRGATKNIGFLAIKEKYPKDYNTIHFVFNDVDTLPFKKGLFTYKTDPGVVKHYYGTETTLGGIVVILGKDFEKMGGFPNFWGWGNEDTMFQNRCQMYNITIDRSVFFPIGSPQILQLFDGVSRIISPNNFKEMREDIENSGYYSIHSLNFTIDDKAKHIKDNLYVCDPFVKKNYITKYITIHDFETETVFGHENFYSYDLRDPVNSITKPSEIKRIPVYHSKKSTTHATPQQLTVDNWKQIPLRNNWKDPRQPPRLSYSR